MTKAVTQCGSCAAKLQYQPSGEDKIVACPKCKMMVCLPAIAVAAFPPPIAPQAPEPVASPKNVDLSPRATGASLQPNTFVKPKKPNRFRTAMLFIWGAWLVIVFGNLLINAADYDSISFSSDIVHTRGASFPIRTWIGLLILGSSCLGASLGLIAGVISLVLYMFLKEPKTI
jgi:hypothetical protein